MGASTHARAFRKLGVVVVLASVTLLLTVGSVAARNTGRDAGHANPGNRHCIAPDTTNLTPTYQAPDWYIPGVTKLCDPNAGSDGIEPMTAYWVLYQTYPNYRWRTTPDNADYSANDCIASYTTCGTQIIGDANDFYTTCHDVLGLSASTVATNIRYWADRARANGTNWRVYTMTENGGYPYRCQFSVVSL